MAAGKVPGDPSQQEQTSAEVTASQNSTSGSSQASEGFPNVPLEVVQELCPLPESTTSRYLFDDVQEPFTTLATEDLGLPSASCNVRRTLPGLMPEYAPGSSALGTDACLHSPIEPVMTHIGLQPPVEPSMTAMSRVTTYTSHFTPLTIHVHSAHPADILPQQTTSGEQPDNEAATSPDADNTEDKLPLFVSMMSPNSSPPKFTWASSSPSSTSSSQQLLTSPRELPKTPLARKRKAQSVDPSDTERAPAKARRVTGSDGSAVIPLGKKDSTKMADLSDDRKCRRRDQNRRAARRSRQRKHQAAQDLMKDYQRLQCSNTNLKYQLTRLQKEKAILTRTLEEHERTCNLRIPANILPARTQQATQLPVVCLASNVVSSVLRLRPRPSVTSTVTLAPLVEGVTGGERVNFPASTSDMSYTAQETSVSGDSELAQRGTTPRTTRRRHVTLPTAMTSLPTTVSESDSSDDD